MKVLDNTWCNAKYVANIRFSSTSAHGFATTQTLDDHSLTYISNYTIWVLNIPRKFQLTQKHNLVKADGLSTNDNSE